MTAPATAEFPATLDSLAAIRRVVDGWCLGAGALSEDRHAMVLAVDEACTNVIEHGYAGADGGWIHLAFEARAHEVRLVVRDTGLAFDPADAPRPDLDAGWEDRPIGGLGWHLIRGMVDEVLYRSDESGNVLTLVKKMATEPTTGAT